MMKLKVCGMKYQDNIEQVAALQPDYLGFIFYEKSTRNFDAESIPELPKSINKTGVFFLLNTHNQFAQDQHTGIHHFLPGWIFLRSFFSKLSGGFLQ